MQRHRPTRTLAAAALLGLTLASGASVANLTHVELDALKSAPTFVDRLALKGAPTFVDQLALKAAPTSAAKLALKAAPTVGDQQGVAFKDPTGDDIA